MPRANTYSRPIDIPCQYILQAYRYSMSMHTQCLYLPLAYKYRAPINKMTGGDESAVIVWPRLCGDPRQAPRLYILRAYNIPKRIQLTMSLQTMRAYRYRAPTHIHASRLYIPRAHTYSARIHTCVPPEYRVPMNRTTVGMLASTVRSSRGRHGAEP